MTVTFACDSDLKSVYSILKMYKDIFSFVRQDRIKKHIQRGTCVFHDDVVITFTKYKVSRVKLQTCSVSPKSGDVWIHQVAAKVQGNGSAKRVLNSFINSCGTSKIFLSVAKSNTRAIAFYEKSGFSIKGEAIYKIAGKDVPSYICVYESVR